MTDQTKNLETAPVDVKQLNKAGFFLRLTILLVDYFLFFTLISFIYNPEPEAIRNSFIFTWLALMAYEFFTFKTPARLLLKVDVRCQRKRMWYPILRSILKFSIGLLINILFARFNKKKLLIHDWFCSTHVVKLPGRLRPVKTVLLFLLSLNIFLTHAIGNLIWYSYLRKFNIDMERLNHLPQETQLDTRLFFAKSEVAAIWNNGMRFSLPEVYKGKRIYSGYGFNGYDVSPPGEGGRTGIFIGEFKMFHPYVNYESASEGIFKYSVHCHRSPAAVLDSIINTTSTDRYFAWNPYQMMKITARLISKISMIYSIGKDIFIRTLHNNGIYIVWTYRRLPSEASFDVIYDTLYLASGEKYNALVIVWKDRKRDEGLVWHLIQSLEFYEPVSSDQENETLLAKKKQSIMHAVNAFRMSGKKYEAAELWYKLLMLKGSTEEKRTFRISIEKLSRQDRRYLKLLYLADQ